MTNIPGVSRLVVYTPGCIVVRHLGGLGPPWFAMLCVCVCVCHYPGDILETHIPDLGARVTFLHIQFAEDMAHTRTNLRFPVWGSWHIRTKSVTRHVGNAHFRISEFV